MDTHPNPLKLETALRAWRNGSDVNYYDWTLGFLILVLGIAVIYLLIFTDSSFAQAPQLPGEDASGKLEAAGTLLRMLDTGLFKWGARIFAGLCIMSAAWALKEQRFGFAVICVIGAILFGTATKWVKNIFSIGDNQGLFSLQLKRQDLPTLYVLRSESGATLRA